MPRRYDRTLTAEGYEVGDPYSPGATGPLPDGWEPTQFVYTGTAEPDDEDGMPVGTVYLKTAA